MSILNIKLNIAGSGCLHQRKTTQNGEIIQDDILKNFFNEIGENKSGYSDIKDFNNYNENDNLHKFIVNLKKRDFFFKFELRENNNILKIIRPGPGADYKSSKYWFARQIGKLYLDIGQYAIKKSIRKCADLINNLVNTYSNIYDKINVKIKGHSRGAVIAEQSVGKLDVFDTNKVKISLSLLDPVSGADFFNHFGLKKIDLSSRIDISSGVVISVNPQRAFGFGEKKVKGAKVIILLPFGHSVGNTNTNRDENGKYRKPNWLFDGKTYKYGEYTELQKGIYYPARKISLTKIGNAKNNYANEKASEVEQRDKSLTIELRKFDINSIDYQLKEMSENLHLKKLWGQKGSRKDYILSILNKNCENKGVIIYDKSNGLLKFNVKNSEDSVFNYLSSIY